MQNDDEISSTNNNSPPPPPKFVKNPDGVRTLNDEWIKWKNQRSLLGEDSQQQQQQQYYGSAPPSNSNGGDIRNGRLPMQRASAVAHRVREEVKAREMLVTWAPAPNASTAIGFCSSVDEMKQSGLAASAAAPSITATQEVFADPDVVGELGGGDPLHKLFRIFEELDVPAGLANRCLVLADLELLEFIVDDSFSMKKDSSVVNRVTGKALSRWQEVKSRITQMLRVLSHIPGLPPISIVFLNNPNSALFNRGRQSPEMFLRRSLLQLEDLFSFTPTGNTPLRQAMWASFQRHKGHSCARYFFLDGCDDDPNTPNWMTQYLMKRKGPAQNPVTFLTCGDPEECGYLSEVEESVPYCAELSPYAEESREVLRDQGLALPYSAGMWLLSCLLAALSPDDLDAMDEGPPLTRFTLANLLGDELNEASYDYYFTNYISAQRHQPKNTPLDHFRVSFVSKWLAAQRDFATVAGPARLLPVTKEYQQRVAALKAEEAKQVAEAKVKISNLL